MHLRSWRKYLEPITLSYNKIKFYLKHSVLWFIVSLIVGIIGGVVGGLFVYGVNTASVVWNDRRWMTYILPFSGLLIVWLYHKCDFKKARGTNRIIDKVRAKEELSFIVAPLMFASTMLTHFFGGSAGREGAAIQMGGSIGSGVANLFKMDEKDTSLMVLSGAAAVFAALFSTPVAAVFFALEFISVGTMYYSGLIPCFVSSITAFSVTKLMGIHGHMWNFIQFPEFNLLMAGKVFIIGIMSALLSILIVVVFSGSGRFFSKFIENPYARVFAGGIIIILLSAVFSSGDYNCSGSHIIENALHGEAKPEAFLVKLLFTAVTLGVGFKGGEIVPVFFMGSTMGVLAGTLLGVDPGTAAALAMIGTFCGAVNSPVASIILSVELFGATGFLYFALCCAASYGFSGYFSLYSSQKIVYSKTKALFVNADTKQSFDLFKF